MDITTEVKSRDKEIATTEKKQQSLKRYGLEKWRTWINGLLEGKRDRERVTMRYDPFFPKFPDAILQDLRFRKDRLFLQCLVGG